MKRTLMMAVLSAALAAPAAAQTGSPAAPKTHKATTTHQAKSGETSSGVAASDKAFAHEAAVGGLTEVELGTLAKEKASSPDVKAFAERMVTDHGKANDELKQWAEQHHVTLPTELDAKHKALAAKLEKANGDAFDKAYTKQGGVAAHKDTLAKLQKASKAVKDTDVKGQVDKTIPVVQEHLKHAEQVASGKMGSTGSSGAAGHTGASH